MVWRVWLTASVRQRLKKLPKSIDEIFQLLLAELGLSGPVQKDWPHYGRFRQGPLSLPPPEGQALLSGCLKIPEEKRKIDGGYLCR